MKFILYVILSRILNIIIFHTISTIKNDYLSSLGIASLSTISYKNNFSDFFNIYKPIFDNPQHRNPKNYEQGCAKDVSIYSGNKDTFNSYCTKCMKYLKYLDDYNNHDYQEKGIIYLYLWLQYYELSNNIYDGNTLENMDKLMYLFEELNHNDTNIQNIYNNEKTKILNDKLYDLYYLYYKFNKFKKDETCTDKKCTCAKECAAKYITSIKKCDNDGNEYLCNELEKFRDQYNIYMPSAEACPGVPLYLPSCKKYSTSVIILISFITILVLSSLFFILYKFTPLGSCVHFRSKRPQKIYSKFTNEEANLIYTRGINRTPEAKPYNIAYNSI